MAEEAMATGFVHFGSVGEVSCHAEPEVRLDPTLPPWEPGRLPGVAAASKMGSRVGALSPSA